MDEILRYAPLAVALAALAATLIAIGRFMGRMEARFDTLTASMNARFAALEAGTNARFDALEAGTNARFDALEAGTNARFDALEAGTNARFDIVDRRLDTLNAWAQGFAKEVNQLFGLVVRMMNRRQQLTEEELEQVTSGFSSLNNPAIDVLFQQERRTRNPLATPELERLEAYYARLRRGKLLTRQELDDYNRLVAVLQADKPSDPGVWALVALGAFVAGLLTGATGDRNRS